MTRLPLASLSHFTQESLQPPCEKSSYPHTWATILGRPGREKKEGREQEWEMPEEVWLSQSPPAGFSPAWALDTGDDLSQNPRMMTTTWNVLSKDNPMKTSQPSEVQQLTIKWLLFRPLNFEVVCYSTLYTWRTRCRRKSLPVRGMVWPLSPSCLLFRLFVCFQLSFLCRQLLKLERQSFPLHTCGR